MEVILDCTCFSDKASTHAYLKERFGFPAYYGNNLDALYDCLTELSDCRILLQNPAALHQMGKYGAALLETMQDAARNNPTLELSCVSADEASYSAEAKERWGSTSAYQEFEQKTSACSDHADRALAEGMDQIFAGFARCMLAGAAPDSADSQALVRQLQDYISANYYTCTKEILSYLGQMYTTDPRFQANIDRHAAGTADYAGRSICIYCQ